MQEKLQMILLVPLMAVISVIVVGALLEDSLHIQNATILLFAAVGGIPALAWLIKSLLSR